jgi:hypothetical protein
VSRVPPKTWVHIRVPRHVNVGFYALGVPFRNDLAHVVTSSPHAMSMLTFPPCTLSFKVQTPHWVRSRFHTSSMSGFPTSVFIVQSSLPALGQIRGFHATSMPGFPSYLSKLHLVVQGSARWERSNLPRHVNVRLSCTGTRGSCGIRRMRSVRDRRSMWRFVSELPNAHCQCPLHVPSQRSPGVVSPSQRSAGSPFVTSRCWSDNTETTAGW